MTVKDRRRVMADLSCITPNTRLLYITPEQADTDSFKVLLIPASLSLYVFCYFCLQATNFHLFTCLLSQPLEALSLSPLNQSVQLVHYLPDSAYTAQFLPSNFVYLSETARPNVQIRKNFLLCG